MTNDESGPFDLNATDVQEVRAVLNQYEGDWTEEEISQGLVQPVRSVVIEYDADGNPVIVDVIEHSAEGGDS